MRRLSGWARLWIVCNAAMWLIAIPAQLSSLGPIPPEGHQRETWWGIFYGTVETCALVTIISGAAYVAIAWVVRGFRQKSSDGSPTR